MCSRSKARKSAQFTGLGTINGQGDRGVERVGSRFDASLLAVIANPRSLGAGCGRRLSVVEPTTGYALLDDQRIAYQIIGDGPIDIVIAPTWFSSFDIEWEEPMARLYLQRLASFTRVIRVDRRGAGASDRFPMDALPPWESLAEDIGCVMDAVGSTTAAVYAEGDAGPLALLFAASHPDRVRALILFHTTARFLADEDYPIGVPLEYADEIVQEVTDDWGSGERLSLYMPSRAGDPEFQRWIGKLQRAVSTPSATKQFIESVITSDARSVLPSIEAPTLILHPTESQLLPIDHGRYLADHIASSTMVELPGGDGWPYFELAEQVLGAIQEFLTGAPLPPPSDRALATVLFTDIVESTSRAEEVGDQHWRGLLDLHDEAVRRGIAHHSGRLVRTTGDGVLATFDGPGRAVRFATTLQAELAKIGLKIRTGIHTGEIELRDDEIGGIAVHLAARIMAVAEPGEILVSRTVKDLVIGSPMTFKDRGIHTLKGIEGEWQLYSVITQ